MTIVLSLILFSCQPETTGGGDGPETLVLSSQIESLQSRLESLQTDYTKVQAKVSELETTNQELAETNGELRNSLEQIRTELSEASTKITEFEGTVQSKNSQIETLQSQLDQANRKADILEKQLDELRNPNSPVTMKKVADTPEVEPSDVISIFSDSYSSDEGFTLPNFDENPNVVPHQVTENNQVLKLSDFSSVVLATTDTPLNLSSMTELHFSYWVEDAESIEIVVVSSAPADASDTQNSLNIPQPFGSIKRTLFNRAEKTEKGYEYRFKLDVNRKATWVVVDILVCELEKFIDITQITSIYVEAGEGETATIYVDDLFLCYLIYSKCLTDEQYNSPKPPEGGTFKSNDPFNSGRKGLHPGINPDNPNSPLDSESFDNEYLKLNGNWLGLLIDILQLIINGATDKEIQINHSEYDPCTDETYFWYCTPMSDEEVDRLKTARTPYSLEEKLTGCWFHPKDNKVEMSSVEVGSQRIKVIFDDTNEGISTFDGMLKKWVQGNKIRINKLVEKTLLGADRSNSYLYLYEPFTQQELDKLTNDPNKYYSSGEDSKPNWFIEINIKYRLIGIPNLIRGNDIIKTSVSANFKTSEEADAWIAKNKEGAKLRIASSAEYFTPNGKKVDLNDPSNKNLSSAVYEKIIGKSSLSTTNDVISKPSPTSTKVNIEITEPFTDSELADLRRTGNRYLYIAEVNEDCENEDEDQCNWSPTKINCRSNNKL